MLQVRRFDPDFSDLPRHWYAGDVVLTHSVNALNLIFPDGERFFVRSVKHFAPRLTDPKLKQDVKDFMGQEAQHGHAHSQQFEVLEAQGYVVRDWLERYKHVAYKRIEPLTPWRWRLATTVALEHLTASFATFALEERFLDEAHPAMRDLLLWHAAEELEHRAVAFEVHRAVGGGYVERVIGMAIALTVLAVFWSSATRHLLRQEPELDRETVRASKRRLAAQGRSRWSLLTRSIGPYLRPGFHPEHAHDGAPATAYLASVGRLGG